MEIVIVFVIFIFVVFLRYCYDRRQKVTNSHALALLSQDLIVLDSCLYLAQYAQDKDIKELKDDPQNAIELHGEKGEAEVMAKIAQTKPLAVYGGVHVYPQNKAKHHEIDHILVFPECVLLIETKNLSCQGKWIQRSEYEKPSEWVHKGHYGTKTIRNPFIQAKVARDSVRDVLERLDLKVPTWSIVLYPDDANVKVAQTSQVWHGRFSEAARLIKEARKQSPKDTPIKVMLDFITMLAKNRVCPQFFDDKGLIRAMQSTLPQGEVSVQAQRLERTPATYKEIHDKISRAKYDNECEIYQLATPREKFQSIFLSIIQNVEEENVKIYPRRARGFFCQIWHPKNKQNEYN